jgi:NAD-dependent dihydropyrimidine dehydrogenase PreA subunit
MATGWYPRVDEGKCKDNCLMCVRFCKKAVFGKHGAKAAVERPDNCIKGCDSCTKICPAGAIAFITTRVIDIDGQEVGIAGLDDVFTRAKDFDTAFRELEQMNYIPAGAKERYREALLREYKKSNP